MTTLEKSVDMLITIGCPILYPPNIDEEKFERKTDAF